MKLEYKLQDITDLKGCFYLCVVDKQHRIALVEPDKSAQYNFEATKLIHIAKYQDIPFLLCEKETILDPNNLDFKSYRDYMHLNWKVFDLIARGLMISHFLYRTQFCGVCTTKTQLATDELCLVCPNCQQMYYPSMDPCVIVAVKKGKQILLAKNVKSTNDMYSVIAGYVELGETLEAAVKREVFEECGVCVDNIRYVESQPWAMPNSLMMAFTCDYVGGEVKPDGIEIVDAAFFDFTNLPLTPGSGTIANNLISYCHTLAGKL